MDIKEKYEKNMLSHFEKSVYEYQQKIMDGVEESNEFLRAKIKRVEKENKKLKNCVEEIEGILSVSTYNRPLQQIDLVLQKLVFKLGE
jgi:chaperonin cofactor prefoldin